MKITNELNSKVNDVVSKKYEKELSVLNEKISEARQQKVEELTEVLGIAIEKFPNLITFVDSLSCNYGSNKTLYEKTKYAYNKSEAYYSDVKELSDEIAKVLERRKNEIENVKIRISYGKSFEDIKDVFTEYGLDF